MAAALNRLLTLCLALAFLVGATGQLIPCHLVQADLTVRADMADGCSGLKAPCTDHLPVSCIDHLGCIAVPGLPASPASNAVAFEWVSPPYNFATAVLSGIS